MWGNFYQWGRKDVMPQAVILANGTLQDVTGLYDKAGTALVTGTTGYKTIHVATAITESGTTNNLAYTIKNVLTFIYTGGNNAGDWYCSNAAYQNSTLWGAVKTIYDPCPRGWKIPMGNTWNDFTGTNTGWIIGVTSGTRLGEGTFPYYSDGILSQTGGKVTNGRLYRDGTSVTATSIAWYPSGGHLSCINALPTGYGSSGFSWACEATGVKDAILLNIGPSTIYTPTPLTRSYGFQARCVKE